MKIYKSLRYLLIITVLGLSFLLLGSMAGDAHAQVTDPAWTAEYWNNQSLSGTPVLTRQEADLNNDWGTGSPQPGVVERDNFSARWTNTLSLQSGRFRFTATADDGVRLWVNGRLVIDEWHDAYEGTYVAEVDIPSGSAEVEMEYYENAGGALARLDWVRLGNSDADAWRGEYYNNVSLNGSPVLVRNDNSVNFNWGTGSPAPGIVNRDSFSVRWTNSLFLDAGTYRFTAISDDGVRVWVNNQLIVNGWSDHPATNFEGQINLPGGFTPIRVEYYDNTGGALVNLYWVQTSTVPAPTPTPDSGEATGVVQSQRLNVRYGPGLQYGVITQLEEGQVVDLTGYRASEGYWVMINWQGSQAWVSGHPIYLDLNVPLSSLTVWTGTVPGTGGQVEDPTAMVVNCYYLNVRSGPGISNQVIEVIPAGTIVTLLGRNEGSGWVRIRLADNTVGWVSTDYLDESVPLATLPVVG